MISISSIPHTYCSKFLAVIRLSSGTGIIVDIPSLTAAIYDTHTYIYRPRGGGGGGGVKRGRGLLQWPIEDETYIDLVIFSHIFGFCFNVYQYHIHTVNIYYILYGIMNHMITCWSSSWSLNFRDFST